MTSAQKPDRHEETAGAHIDTVRYLYQTLRTTLLCAGLACTVGSMIAPWFYTSRWNRNLDAVQTDVLSLAEAVLTETAGYAPGTAGYAPGLYGAAGAILVVVLWLCAAAHAGAQRKTNDTMVAAAVLAACALLACWSSAVTGTTGPSAQVGAGLPLILLALALNGVCATRLHRPAHML